MCDSENHAINGPLEPAYSKLNSSWTELMRPQYLNMNGIQVTFRKGKSQPEVRSPWSGGAGKARPWWQGERFAPTNTSQVHQNKNQIDAIRPDWRCTAWLGQYSRFLVPQKCRFLGGWDPLTPKKERHLRGAGPCPQDTARKNSCEFMLTTAGQLSMYQNSAMNWSSGSLCLELN